MSAAWTITPSSRPQVSTATCRLRPLTFLAASQPRGPPFRRLHALGVDHGCARARLTALPLAQHHYEMMADRLPHACARERAHVLVHRPPGRDGRGWWQVAPLAAGSHEVE